MKARNWVLGVICTLVAAASAFGQAYPDRPIKLVVPFAPGGGSDVMARMIAPRLADALGQPVVVENRAGAGGNIGAGLVAKAAPDGYTLLLANVALGINAGFPGQLPFDVLKDFSPVAMVGTSALVVAVHPSVQARTIPELLAIAKARPAALSYASCGSGTLQHMGAELLKRVGDFRMVHIPYRGCSQAVAAAVSGEVPVTFNAISNVLPFVKGGQLRLLAVGSNARLKAYPDVPTIAEAGFANYDADLWLGVLAPAGTPPAIVARLNAAVAQAVSLPEVQDQYRRQLLEPRLGTPEQFSALLRREVDKWSGLIKGANIKAD